ncbi:hypothetical protein [Streptacidiphilus melanogenes]|uniref:hypothetical protein n=1 Tax=Streptacidiphilus melanogenes TaxID=411235 RepID=UPI0007C84C03|nr:hypothetical protein [Streptacidiphilus melanogenes]
MIIILGLIILIAAAVVAVAGIFTNTGSAHAVNGAFSVFGHHMTGSTGALFLFGIIVGAAAMLGLGLLLVGARRTSRRGIEARHALRHSRRETVAAGRDRDDLIEERDSARAESASAGRERDDLAQQRDDLAEQRDDLISQQRPLATPVSRDTETPGAEAEAAPPDGTHRGLHLFGHRPAHR